MGIRLCIDNTGNITKHIIGSTIAHEIQTTGAMLACRHEKRRSSTHKWPGHAIFASMLAGQGKTRGHYGLVGVCLHNATT